MSERPVARRIRRSARILLTDDRDRLLLFRYAPQNRPAFWCAPGGECDPGEDFAVAARRELFEETGLDTEPGPEIAQRADDYVTLEGEPITSDERFYRVRAPAFEVDTSGHTELERKMQMEPRWFTFAEVAQWHEPIFPDTILELVALDTTGETA
ncbi:DNA mismatch repair protein MutT [Novosphingobium sp. AAP83]|uniref:NUDIX hydrolase n=1 Tax=Novosphingobium sp. AAP83 TaxID=1523425 RepID=UPI0006B9E4BE|nr:NUDIX domain-containing protein [Novosphingobium sp. AAP83]KPF93365.1 DNA mismatch repair protein MutT [Novosphingobium sp. AAP83]